MLWYPACPDCKKKLIDENTFGQGGGDGSGNNWHCERCNKYFPEPNWTFNFSCKLGDTSDVMYAQVLGEKMGADLIGLNAKEMRAMGEQDPAFQSWETCADIDGINTL